MSQILYEVTLRELTVDGDPTGRHMVTVLSLEQLNDPQLLLTHLFELLYKES